MKYFWIVALIGFTAKSNAQSRVVVGKGEGYSSHYICGQPCVERAKSAAEADAKRQCSGDAELVSEWKLVKDTDYQFGQEFVVASADFQCE